MFYSWLIHFENFRTTSLTDYELDPSNYLSYLGMAWGAMLLNTGVKLDLITDLEMLGMIEQENGAVFEISARTDTIRLTITTCQITIRADIKFIPYEDANHLYAWAMKLLLPYRDLKSNHDISLRSIFEYTR